MRGKSPRKRSVAGDELFGSTEVTKLINRVMKDGKKATAQQQVYGAFSIIKSEMKAEPLDVFKVAIGNITPQIEVRSRRVGGAAYQVPMPVKPRRSFSLAVRWLVEEARKRSNKEYKTFSQKLAAELMDAYNNDGGAIQKKITSKKMADANKAFAHFRW